TAQVRSTPVKARAQAVDQKLEIGAAVSVELGVDLVGIDVRLGPGERNGAAAAQERGSRRARVDLDRLVLEHGAGAQQSARVGVQIVGVLRLEVHLDQRPPGPQLDA